jgi:hypothetical protein
VYNPGTHKSGQVDVFLTHDIKNMILNHSNLLQELFWTDNPRTHPKINIQCSKRWVNMIIFAKQILVTELRNIYFPAYYVFSLARTKRGKSCIHFRFHVLSSNG